MMLVLSVPRFRFCTWHRVDAQVSLLCWDEYRAIISACSEGGFAVFMPRQDWKN